MNLCRCIVNVISHDVSPDVVYHVMRRESYLSFLPQLLSLHDYDRVIYFKEGLESPKTLSMLKVG